MTNNVDAGAFDYRVTKDGKVFVTYYGKQVKVLKGKQAAKLLARVDGASDHSVQLALAKVTGNFKHGNEHPE